jgi:hypothetical protein
MTPIIGYVGSRAPAPPDGMSAQIQASGVYVVAAPTPDDVNATTGTGGPACPTDPPDAGMMSMPDGSMTGDSGFGPDAGNNNNGGDGGCCSADRNVAGTFALACVVVVVLSASSSRRRRRP